MPVAPGTAASLLALVIYLVIPSTGRQLLGLFLPLIFFLGVLLAWKAERSWSLDDRRITIDEMAGMWLSVVWLPVTIPVLVGAFFLFRFFDILKPLGIGRMQKLPHGWGVMMDDILAGIYVNIIIRIFLWIPVGQ